jgi:hypothetical protein
MRRGQWSARAGRREHRLWSWNLERLDSLRAMPVFAEGTAKARRDAARLREQNRRLLGEVRRLQRERRASDADGIIPVNTGDMFSTGVPAATLTHR